MTPHPFEAALTHPAYDASYFQLCTLISARDYSGPTLPAFAENYLHAFCTSSLSSVRRRWVGVALTGMLAMPDVAAHIQKLSELLQNLGDIILDGGEREVTKIVAGMIIRQALGQGFEYRRFWSSEKVRNSVPTFPQEANAKWIQYFRAFLETLDGLALTGSPGEPGAMHFIFLSTSDGFSVQEPDNSLPITVLEGGIMVVVAPDDHFQECQFVDIPVNHILGMRLEPSTVHSCQSRRTKTAPCGLVITLKTDPWSYQLDSVQRVANEMSIMFKHPGDALKWQESIEQHQKEHEAHPKMSRRFPVDTSPSSPRSSSLHPSPERSALKESSKTSDDSLVPKLRPPLAASQAALEAGPTKRFSPPKRTTYSKGKLPIVSQAAKQQALKQLNAQSDDVDLRAKNKGKEGTTSNTPSPDPSHRKLAKPSKAAPGKKIIRSTKKRKSHVRRKMDDDDDKDYIPDQKKSKKRMTAKRQSDFDVADDRKRVKKPRVEPEGHADLADMARRRRDRYRTSVKSHTSCTSSRHSLIGGLKGLRKYTEPSEIAFKKPTLPARIAQTPSTPTKPRKRLEELRDRTKNQRAAKTPMDDGVYAQMASSPSVACEAGESRDWLQGPTVETEILSSNSKPVPASPNAESTAISGHADHDDVASEKRTGDSQTAKSDPFIRRSDSKKSTSFIRRLTGGDLPNVDYNPVSGISHSAADAVRFSSTSEVGAVMAAIPLLAQSMPWQQKRYSPSRLNLANAKLCPHPDATSIAPSNDVDSPNHTPALGGNKEEHIEQPTKQRTVALSVEERDAEHLEVVGNDLPNSLTFTTQEVINYAPFGPISHESNLGMERHTLVGGSGFNRQDNTDLEVCSMQFHSSPPTTGLPNSNISTSAESLSSLQQPLPCSQIEEMDWEASLEPHQRSLHELLIRTSKRVMRHIVDAEASINGIAGIFSSDGEHVLSSLMQRHAGDYERVFRGMESKREGLQMELERATKHLVDERERLNAMA
ncbi:hypothetical protein DDE83_007004 [Stemphylium lycopersici]|uniref:Uncharacterized protein n=1 Tax=Stemphylium lycopersici TaxID=183478 RepID=A0A364MXF9_STELY|nr:hypothetical protein DDE83_007004 [Stemphylium lycopersici]